MGIIKKKGLKMIITDIDNFEDNIRGYLRYATNEAHKETIYVRYDENRTFVIMTTDELNNAIKSAIYVAQHVLKKDGKN
jgi:hypothetical protein